MFVRFVCEMFGDVVLLVWGCVCVRLHVMPLVSTCVLFVMHCVMLCVRVCFLCFVCVGVCGLKVFVWCVSSYSSNMRVARDVSCDVVCARVIPMFCLCWCMRPEGVNVFWLWFIG